MNPFDKWNNQEDVVNIDDWLKQNNAAKNTSKVAKTPAPKQKTRGRGGTLTSLISDVGGTGGALGGAAAGASIGSIVPGVGTVIGGLIGAGLGGFLGGTGGQLAENKIRDDQFNAGSALKSGAVSGLLSVGPGKLLKAGSGLVKGGAKDLASAVADAGVDAAGQPLKTSLRGKLTALGNQTLTNQYGTISKPVARANDPLKTIGKLADYGIVKPKDAERIAGRVTGSSGLINKAVLAATDGAKKVPLNGIPELLAASTAEHGLVDTSAKSIESIVNSQLKRFGEGATEGDPNTALKVLKSLEAHKSELLGKGGTSHLATTEDKAKARVLGAVHDKLEKNLFKVADANGNIKNVLTPEFQSQLTKLHPGNGQWKNFVDNTVMKVKGVDDLRSTMAPFVKVSKIINEGDTNALTFGGRVGNSFIGGGGGLKDAILGAGVNAVKNPASRIAGKGLRAAASVGSADGLIAPTTKGIVNRLGFASGLDAAGKTYGELKNGGRAFSAGLGAVAGDPSQDPSQSSGDLSSALMDAQGATATGNSINDFNALPDSGSGQSGISPYSQQNLIADIQRDPKNADKYISTYKELDGIFNPTEPASAKLNSTQVQQANTAQSGLDSLQAIAQAIQSNPNAAKLSNLPGGSLTGNLTHTGEYKAAIANAVDAIGRLRSGGAIGAEEQKNFLKFLPGSFDDPQTVQFKLQQLNSIFSRFANPQAASDSGGSDLTSALMSAGYGQ